MTNFLKRFAQDESGAVTVDWVVLTAVIVGIGLAVGSTISGQLDTAATAIGADITASAGAGTDGAPE